MARQLESDANAYYHVEYMDTEDLLELREALSVRLQLIERELKRRSYDEKVSSR